MFQGRRRCSRRGGRRGRGGSSRGGGEPTYTALLLFLHTVLHKSVSSVWGPNIAVTVYVYVGNIIYMIVCPKGYNFYLVQSPCSHTTYFWIWPLWHIMVILWTLLTPAYYNILMPTSYDHLWLVLNISLSYMTPLAPLMIKSWSCFNGYFKFYFSETCWCWVP